jgi:MoaA/NifB/PqqE/SkfB family radical SAM enzyme
MNEETLMRLAKKILPLGAYRFIKNKIYHPAKENLGLRDIWLKHPIAIFGRYPGFLYPKTLAICLTTKCNLRCFICRREDFVAEDMPFENIYKLKNAIKHARVIDLTGWGEWLMYPRYREVLDYIFSLNKRPDLLQITSNGSLVSAELARLLTGKIKSFKISLNAASPETYKRDMKGSFEKTTGRLAEFISALNEKDRQKLTLHMVAHTLNYKEIPDFVELAAKLKVPNVTIGNYMTGIPEHESFTLLNVKNEYNEVVKEAKTKASALKIDLFAREFFTDDNQTVRCQDPYNICFIEVDGEVGPCCYCGSYRIGNAYEQDFEAIWFSNKYAKLRKVRYLKVCEGCSPYVSLDNPRAHYTGHYKEKDDESIHVDNEAPMLRV